MESQDFVYWLQGYFELNGSNELNERQVRIIKDHLAQVLTKVTPNRPNKVICAKVASKKSDPTFC